MAVKVGIFYGVKGHRSDCVIFLARAKDQVIYWIRVAGQTSILIIIWSFYRETICDGFNRPISRSQGDGIEVKIVFSDWHETLFFSLPCTNCIDLSDSLKKKKGFPFSKIKKYREASSGGESLVVAGYFLAEDAPLSTDGGHYRLSLYTFLILTVLFLSLKNICAIFSIRPKYFCCVQLK